MNLQITSPYKFCPYRCPFCVSNFEGEYKYENLFEENEELYLKKLGQELQSGDYEGVVLTGMTEPTLFPNWITVVRNLLRYDFPHIETTLQTANLLSSNLWEFDVWAISISNRKQLKQLSNANQLIEEGHIVRFTIMLSSLFNFSDIVDLIALTDREAQYTVKYLQPTSNKHRSTDRWIKENAISLLEDEETILREERFWIDKTCMDNEHRYRIFREDGRLYKSWN